MFLSFQSSALLSLAASTVVTVVAAQECGTTWMCNPTITPPTLDGNLTDWADVVGAYQSTMVQPLTAAVYDAGDVTYKCQYDADNIYFALEIPGEFRFNATNDHQCASIATMTKIGSMATFDNMGGCPDAMGGCTAGGAIPDTCTDYRVDIGAHWELSETNAGSMYGIGDEYSASPYCRLEDDDADAGQEWSGAWAHTNPVEGESGMYQFELVRSLKTASTFSDAQITAGDTIQFGVAFWDPFETDEGWDDATHFVTGCANNWIDLELAVDSVSGATAVATVGSSATSTDSPPAEKSNGSEIAAAPSAAPRSSLLLAVPTAALLLFVFGPF